MYVPSRFKQYSPYLRASRVAHMGSIPGSGRSPGGGHGNSLRYSCLENPKDWWATVRTFTKSQTQLSMHVPYFIWFRWKKRKKEGKKGRRKEGLQVKELQVKGKELQIKAVSPIWTSSAGAATILMSGVYDFHTHFCNFTTWFNIHKTIL